MRRSAASSRSAWALPVSRRLALSCAASAPWSLASLSASLRLGEALVADGEFAAQPPDLVGLGRGATRFRLQGALRSSRAPRRFRAVRSAPPRAPSRRAEAAGAARDCRAGRRRRRRRPLRARPASAAWRAFKAGVRVLDQRVLGFQLLQSRLAGLELDQQVGQRRQQGVELLARPFGAGEPVPDLLELGAQRLVAHADRLERPFRPRAAARRPARRRPASRAAGRSTDACNSFPRAQNAVIPASLPPKSE